MRMRIDIKFCKIIFRSLERYLYMIYSHDLYFESAAVIITLITLGKYFETITKGKTSEAIKKLRANIKEGLSWASGYITLGIPVAREILYIFGN